MTEQQKEKAKQTRQEHRSKREAKEREKAQELALMRSRLVKALDNPTLTDSEAVQAVSLLWSITEKSRHYLS